MAIHLYLTFFSQKNVKNSFFNAARNFIFSVPALAILICSISEPLLSSDDEEKLSMVSNHMTDQMEVLISPEEISEKIKEVAAQINAEYKGKELTIVMLMKGAVCVTADLIRAVNVPLTLEYVKASSYGKLGTKQGELTIAGLDALDLESKDILLIDDIFDTGKTMTSVMALLQEKKPNSLKTLVLLLKNTERTITTYRPDYVLFEIEDRFVVGYGLDYNEHYRGLPGVYIVN